jgi:hypothetical protein
MRALLNRGENKRSNQQSKSRILYAGVVVKLMVTVTKRGFVDLETNAGMLNRHPQGYEGLRAEELMPDLGPARASRGLTIGT